MLTIDTLNQNAVLSSLTDDQKKAIEEMSRNDENQVISTRIGELHGSYDKDIKAVTGIDKNGGEKSYDYLKRVLSGYKEDIAKSSGLKAELEAANAKIKDLESKGADESVRKQLSDEKARNTQLQEALSKSLADMGKMKEDHECTLKNIIADNEFDKVVGGMKFKSSVTDGMKSVMIAAAKAEVKAKGDIEVQTMADGTKKVVIRGKDGNILNNPSNNLNPYTLAELFGETCIKDIVDTGRRVPGGGTGPEINGHGFNLELDLSEAKTQVEADRLIESHLMKKGLTRDSKEFASEMIRIRTEAKVGDLPIR